MAKYTEGEIELQGRVAAEICDEIYGRYVNAETSPNKWAACIESAIRVIALLESQASQ